jgi:hypothetical protein
MSILSSSTLQKRLNIMSLYSKYIIKEETIPYLHNQKQVNHFFVRKKQILKE